MCGLFGQISDKPVKFDDITFYTLGVANDYRGGDSCGVFIDGIYYYGVDKEKLFSNFYQKPFFKEIEKCSIAFGHCRKASVGVINKSTAQPIVIEQDGKPVYVLMHNGTIYNYKKLAIKYIPNENIDGLTDSQVMAKIFFNCGYDVLSEYEGYGVFVIADYRNNRPKVLFFKGANTFHGTSYEERPLYYSINNGVLTFSSIDTFLRILKGSAIQLPCNILMEYNNGFKAIKRYEERSTCNQKSVFNYKDIEYYNYNNYDYEDCDYEDNYCRMNPYTCRYTSKNTPIFGLRYILESGYISKYKIKQAQEVWFYDGIPLRNYECFAFLKKLDNKSPNFNNILYYLSKNIIYNDNGIWKKAISPLENEVFTGTFHPFNTHYYKIIIDGKEKSTSYDFLRKKEFVNEELSINFKKLYEICKFMMKSK